MTTPRRFDWCFSRSRDDGQPDGQPLSVFLQKGVVPRAEDDGNHNRLGSDLSKYLVVRPGDLVFNKLRAWQGGFGHSAHHGIVSPAYFVCRPNPGIDARFVDYLLHVEPMIGELRRRSKWQPPSQFDLPWDQLRTLWVEVPDALTQRGTADFLDRECELIARMRKASFEPVGAAEGLAERGLFDALRTLDLPPQRLRFGIAQIGQGWSPECWDRPRDADEWGVLKLGCVNGGTFTSEHKTLPVELEPRPELEVVAGDLVMSRANTRTLVGSAAVVPQGIGRRLMLSDLLYRVRLRPEIWYAPYVAAVLNSPIGRGQIEAAAGGSSGSMPKISQQVIRDLRLPCPNIEQQVAIADDYERTRESVARAASVAHRLDAALIAYRDSLIHEAVTGTLDITRVSDRQMDERLHAATEDRLDEVTV